MNENNPYKRKPNQFEQSFDKTFDENAMIHSAGFTKLPASFTNISQSQNLPEDNEQIELGSGKIEGILGTGGMARVYKIWNEKLEVYRAVKILLPNSQKELLKRFETEAKITAKLHHPNIVEIYNVGEWNGLPYIEMEMIEGMTLDSLISKYGKLPAEVCCAIGIQTTDALDYAHSQEFLLYGKTYKGVVHRDLKPANIMLSNSGVLKLMDFGIARPAEAGLHTMDGHIVGTLQYLSPEQLDGIAIDNRTDIYSLGTILYEILTGTKTFPQTSITNLMKMKATNTYRKFSEYNFHISSSLAKATEKCLQTKRENRYRYIKDLLAELEKSNRSFTFSPPGEVLREYMKDPIKYAVDNKLRRKFTNKHIMMVSSAVVIFFLIITFAMLSPRKEQNKDISKTPVQIKKTVTGQPKKPDISKKEFIPPLPPKLSQSTRNDKTLTAKKVKKITPALKLKPKEPVFVPKQEESVFVPKPEKAVLAPKPKIEVEKQPARKPQRTVTIKAIPKPQPKAEIPVDPVKPIKLSPLEKLKKKYNEKNPLTLGINSCARGNYTDALIAFNALNDKSFKKTIHHMWALVELGKYSDASKISSDLNKRDAFADLLLGRIEAAVDKNRSALTYYEEALLKPSIVKSRINIRKDALYYIAIIYDKHYGNSPSSETYKHTKNAWKNLKRVYQSTPDHPRFKLANKKLASLN